MTNSKHKLIRGAVLGLLLPAACTDLTTPPPPVGTANPRAPVPTAATPAAENPTVVSPAAVTPTVADPAPQQAALLIDETPGDPSLDPCPPCGRG